MNHLTEKQRFDYLRNALRNSKTTISPRRIDDTGIHFYLRGGEPIPGASSKKRTDIQISIEFKSYPLDPENTSILYSFAVISVRGSFMTEWKAESRGMTENLNNLRRANIVRIYDLALYRIDKLIDDVKF